jgi:hypothetical protein
VRHVALDGEFLEDCLNRESSDKDKAWEDLGKLVPYLDDHLVLVERARVFEGGTCNLTVFLANDDEKTPLYVLVGNDGVVCVGRVDRLRRHVKRRLDGFDRLWHGVLSVSVTRQHRLLGTRQDLWIVVRKKDDEIVVYHGLVDLDEDGRPVLEPAADDWKGVDERQWRAGTPKGLPEWLSCCNFACSPEVEPFQELPNVIQQIIQGFNNDLTQQVEAVYWTGSALGLALGQVIQLYGVKPHVPPAVLDFGERVRTVALTKGPHGALGVAAPDAHRLAAFQEWDDALLESWRHRTHEFPVALAFLPVAEPDSPWPDLLVAFQDGDLHRLRYVGKERMHEVWDAAWRRLLPDDEPDQRIAVAREIQYDENESCRRAALVGVVEKVIAEMTQAPPEVRERWLEEVSGLFRPAERFQVLADPLLLLLDALERSLFQSGGVARPLSKEARFLAALVHRLYTGQLYLAMRDQVDEAFRAMDLPQEHRENENLNGLADFSIRNRETIWRQALSSNTAPEALIQRAIFGLERWANVYLFADGRQIAPSRKEVLTGLGWLAAQKDTDPWVISGRRDELRAYPLDRSSTLSRPPIIAALPGGSIQEVISLGKAGVAVARSSGELSVWGIDAHAGQERLSRRSALELSNLGVPWALAQCQAEGRPVIAAVYNRRRISTVVLCSFEPEGLQEIARIPLDLPRVRSLDLSLDGEGNFLVAAGSVHATPVRIYRIDRTGQGVERRWLRVLESGASAVRFSSPVNPELLLAGERNGLLWCCDVKSTSEVSDLVWTYDLGGTIRAIEPVVYQKRTQFLAGSENGRLVLLDGRTGRRVWKHRLTGAIRQIQEVRERSPAALVVTLRGGRAVVFTQVDDRQKALNEVKGYLTALGHSTLTEHKDQWDTVTAAPVKGIFRMLVQKEGEAQILRKFPARETRARLVRYLAEEVPPPQLQDSLGAIVRELSRREMALLLSSLDDAMTEWDDAVARELSDRPARTRFGDDGVRAGMAASVVLLQRRARRDAPRVLRERLAPPAELLSVPWTRLELARILLAETSRQWAPREPAADELVVSLLPHLLELPLAMVRACAQVMRYGSPPEHAFSSLSLLLDDLSRERTPHADRGRKFARSLVGVKQAGSFFPFLGDLAGFLAAYLEMKDDLSKARTAQDPVGEWRKKRSECLVPLRDLVRSSGCVTEEPEPFRELVRCVRQWLAEPFPPDQASLAQRTNWLRAARRHLDETILDETGLEDSSEWRRIAWRLTQETRQALENLERWESQHISLLTRPFLKLLDFEVNEGNKARLRFRFEPEGQRQLEDVTIWFRVTSEGGLQGPGQRETRSEAMRFPGRSVERDIELSGFLQPGQESVSVEVETRDASGYLLQELWTFPVPRKLSVGSGRLSIPGDLPKTFQTFLDRALQCKGTVGFFVIDEDLGRAEMVQRWQGRTGGRVVSLDDQLRQIGKGRRYSNRQLDLEILERACQGGDPLGTTDLSRSIETEDISKPLLITPVEETLERLTETEVEGLLEGWLASLRQRAERSDGHPWFFVLSSLHACRLRTLGLEQVEEIALHRVVFQEPGSRAASLREEIESLLRNGSGLPSGVAQKAVDRLGGDVRFVIRWLRWLRDDVRRKAAPSPVDDFLASPPIDSLLRAELRALPPLDLLTALLASEAVTYLPLKQVADGQVAADDYRSTTRKRAPKLIQKEGQIISERALQALSSDLRHVDSLAVQGIGLTGSIEAPQSTLLALVTARRREERQASIQRLTKMGVGRQIGNVFRTGSPYRDLIRTLQDEAAPHHPPGSRWEGVYTALAGKDRSPAENLPLVELSRHSAEDLEKMFPGARASGRDDIRTLRRLAEFWNSTSEEEIEGILSQLFRPGPVARLEAHASRWDRPLARLLWPVFGIGSRQTRIEEDEQYPDTYLIWSFPSPVLSQKEIEVIGAAAEETERLCKLSIQGSKDKGRWTPRVLVLGPGADGAPPDTKRRLAVLRSSDLCRSAWAGELREGLLRRGHSQMKLTARSPFQASGALPAGSPLFVGRSEELDFIKSRIRRTSILILGSRRVGKTSLLNQVDYWAQSEPDLEPVFVDLQGCADPTDFLDRLRKQLPKKLRNHPAGDLDEFSRSVQEVGRTPVLLLNEIDGLLTKSPDFIASWRGLNDRPLARFLMVGYSAIGALGIPDSPFFHFTEGNRFENKALVLGALSKGEGARILDQLETTLGVRWESNRDKDLSYKLCLDRSYRIPWVLQRYAHLLVEYLENARKESLTLSFQEVERVVETEGRVVWNYIEGIDYKSLGFGRDENASRPGFQLVLVAVARKKYFLGGANAPIRDPHLAERSPLSKEFVFSVGEAREIVKGTIANLLMGKERQIVERWFDGLDLEKAFRLLTLTLMLEPAPLQDRSYGFLLHILPRELHQLRAQDDPSLDTLFVNHAVEFLRSLKRGR